jgi:YtkA-like protein
VKRPNIVPGVLFTIFAWTILAASAAGSVFADAPAAGKRNGCDLQHGPCVRETDDGTRVEFDIQPKPVIAMSGSLFSVRLFRNGKPVTDASSVILDLSMPGMYMGKNRPALKKTDNGRYEGKGVITRCMSNSKTWQAEISVERKKKISVVVFEFEVQ